MTFWGQVQRLQYLPLFVATPFLSMPASEIGASPPSKASKRKKARDDRDWEATDIVDELGYVIDDANKELRKMEHNAFCKKEHGKLMKRFKARLRKLKERVATYTKAEQSRMEAEHLEMKRKRNMMKIAQMKTALQYMVKRDMEKAKAKH